MVEPSEPQELQVEDLYVVDLHIFVNRRKFEEGDGVRSEMTGRQVAALVNVPAENAIVRVESVPSRGEVGVVVETGPEPGEVEDLDNVITIVNGMQFLVTRRIVEGG
jgi:hypothetical protein